MNDSLSIQPIVLANVTGTVLTTARVFERIADANPNNHMRANSTLGSLSPTTLRISHSLRGGKNTVQKSLVQLNQTLTRVDALSNPIGEVGIVIKLTAEIPAGVTEAEFLAAAAVLIGGLTSTGGTLSTLPSLGAIYRGEY